MHNPDPEHTVGGETKVEITDLDLPDRPLGRPTRWNWTFPFLVPPWMRIGAVVGIVIIATAILVNVSQIQKGARITRPPLPTFYPVSLSVVNGICYASSTNGVVTALRVSDGSLLWHHEGGKAGEGSATVVDGIIYVVPFTRGASTVTIEALHASDGSLLWSRTLPTDSSMPVQPTIVNGVVYVWPEVRVIDALRASDGSLLWHYTSPTPFLSAPSEADGIVYVGTQDGHFSALRANDGTILWQYTSLIPLSSAIMADGVVLLRLQGGSMDVVRASTGLVLWHYTSSVPEKRLLFPPLVANGVIYAMMQDGYLSAFRANNGVVLWRMALHTPNFLSLMSGIGGVIYVGMLDGSIETLQASDGAVLWHYQSGGGRPASIIVAQGIIYLAFYTRGINSIGSIAALRANDGVVLWHSTPHVPAKQLLPVVADGLVLIALEDGTIDAIRANNGSLLWHRTIQS